MPYPKLAYPFLAVVVALLAACAQVQPKAEPPAAARIEEGKPAALPHEELTAQQLYQYLIGEVALQRSQPRLAAEAMLDLAKNTRDPRLAKRATETAVQARQADVATEAATLWQSLDPDSAQASQAAAALLLNSGDLKGARPYLEKLLAGSPDGRVGGFFHLNQMLARQKDHMAVLELVQALAKPYPDSPEAHFAVAQAAWNAGKRDEAQAELRKVNGLRPGWEPAALYQGQMLQETSPVEALDFYRDFLRDYPKSTEVRLAYARVLVGQKRYHDARAQFQRLMDDAPNNAEVSFAIGLLASQESDFESADLYLKRALANGYKDEDMVRFYLGQVAEERKGWEDAAKWYGQVGDGEFYLNAQIHLAGALAKQGKLDDAVRRLQQVEPANNQQRALLIQAEAQLMREAGRYQAAFDLLGRGLEKLPNYPDLLYDHAMAAEKLEKLDILEKDLRRLIEIKPDYANAYNALGYTFADRGIRLDEARSLVEKALTLAPDDPFVMDSMGWVYFRFGEYDKAAELLRKALALRPDPEISAHLGEVLWAKGSLEDARKVWRSALDLAPDNEVLRNVMQKYK